MTTQARLPFDSIKIDRSFVARLSSSRESAERAIAGLAHSLHMSVIAEGIETREQLVWLRALGCAYGQGYLFSPPVARAQPMRLLEDWPDRRRTVMLPGEWLSPQDAGTPQLKPPDSRVAGSLPLAAPLVAEETEDKRL